MKSFVLGLIVGMVVSSAIFGSVLYLRGRVRGEELIIKERDHITVEVKGEVKRPGVYEVKPGIRVKELIELAGGFTEDAFTEEMDLVRRLYHDETIYVPKKGEVPQKVNINTAPVWLLKALPGIDEELARRIVEGRPYRSIEDIKRVKGIGERKFELIKDKITTR